MKILPRRNRLCFQENCLMLSDNFQASLTNLPTGLEHLQSETTAAKQNPLLTIEKRGNQNSSLVNTLHNFLSGIEAD